MLKNKHGTAVRGNVCGKAFNDWSYMTTLWHQAFQVSDVEGSMYYHTTGPKELQRLAEKREWHVWTWQWGIIYLSINIFTRGVSLPFI